MVISALRLATGRTVGRRSWTLYSLSAAAYWHAGRVRWAIYEASATSGQRRARWHFDAPRIAVASLLRVVQMYRGRK